MGLPHEGGVDLSGEGVVLQRGDLPEDVREEQVEQVHGDGRQILEQQSAPEPSLRDARSTREEGRESERDVRIQRERVTMWCDACRPTTSPVSTSDSRLTC